MIRGREAWVVLDLGFGDAGKGTITDWLVRERGARLVVRWNGGAQSGHNVVAPDGRHHTFSQFGAGSFVPGTRTHLAETVVVHPTALLVESRVLEASGIADPLSRLTIAGSARIVTPFHQAAGRLRELARGAARHGTCGVGVGEAVRDAAGFPEDAILARDLLAPDRALLAKVARVRERVRASVEAEAVAPGGDPRAAVERGMLENPEVDVRWTDALGPIRGRGIVVSDEALGGMLEAGPVVLEGAQGVLLDEDHGFHPHTSWSRCTGRAAESLLGRHGFDGEIRRIGVLRAFLTRHGEGPFPTRAPELERALPEPHNSSEGWQGAFRIGWPDPILSRYALAASGGVDGLALTHMDRMGAVREWFAAARYEAPPCSSGREAFERDAKGAIRAIRPFAAMDFESRERLTRVLERAVPVLERIPVGRDRTRREAEFADWVEQELQAQVWIESRSPTAAGKGWRGPFRERVS